MDDESGESIEPMEEVPLEELIEPIGEISAKKQIAVNGNS